jgi:hypothetical protein
MENHSRSTDYNDVISGPKLPLAAEIAVPPSQTMEEMLETFERCMLDK